MMNSKFFDVRKDKQDAIINAALHTFAVKGYKDASTDVIVKEAGISKGLLFHYFTSKQGLYDFICDYSTKYMILELTRSVKKNQKDLFELMAQISQGRVRVMRNYPYMYTFLQSLRAENDPEAREVMGSCIEDMDRTYRNFYDVLDAKRLVQPDQLARVISVIEWVCDGYLKESAASEPDPDRFYEEYSGYLTLLRDHFCVSEDDDKISVAREELFDRNETVMKEMKMDMTFEERLMAGRKPLVETDDEEEDANEAEESTSSDEASGEDVSDIRADGETETFDDIIREAEKNIQSLNSGI